MAPPRTRTLPLRVSLEPGEALDSWLLRLAARYQTPLAAIWAAFGAAARQRRDADPPNNPTLPYLWVRDPPAAALRRIEVQAGLVAGVLDPLSVKIR